MLVNAQGHLVQEAGDPPIISIPTSRTVPLEQGAPVAVVWHWTAGDVDDDTGHADSVSLAKWIAGGRGASWHVLIDKNGTLVQSAPFLRGTNHVGQVADVLGVRRSVNRTCLGIELENAGDLRRIGERLYAWPYFRRNEKGVPDRALGVDPKLAVSSLRGQERGGVHYDRYTEAQEKSAELLVRAIAKRFGFERPAFEYGHVTFRPPSGKIDPGPLWMDDVLPRVLGRVFGARKAAAS